MSSEYFYKHVFYFLILIITTNGSKLSAQNFVLTTGNNYVMQKPSINLDNKLNNLNKSDKMNFKSEMIQINLVKKALIEIETGTRVESTTNKQINFEDPLKTAAINNDNLFNKPESNLNTANQSFGTVSNCNNDNCKPEYASCTSTTICTCKPGYLEIKQLNQKTSVCSYKQKLQLTAFMLELSLGFFGAGHFYRGAYIVASIKCVIFFILPIIFLIIACLFFFRSSGNSDQEFTKNLSLLGTSIALIILFAIWSIVDTILYGLNFWKDSNGIALKHW